MRSRARTPAGRAGILGLFMLTIPASGAGEELRFALDGGGARNRFLRDEAATAHLVVSSRPRPRVILAFPEGNTGAGIWLSPGAGSAGSPELTLVGDLETVRDGEGRGARARLSVDAPEVRVDALLMGSVRTLRDYNLLGENPRLATLRRVLPVLEAHPSLREPAARVRAWLTGPRVVGGALVLERPTLGGPHRLRAALRPLGSTRLERGRDGTLRLRAPRVCRFEVVATHDLPRMRGVPPERLLSPAAAAALRERARRAPERGPRLRARREHLAFLTYPTELLAGSWRFLTYFGRDTMLSLRLMAPALSREVLEGGLAGVLDRLSPGGDVAHEEDLADQAAYARLAALDPWEAEAGERSRALLALLRRRDALGAPRYDYAMVDGDLMLPLLARDVLRGMEPGDRRRFLDTPVRGGGRTRREALEANAGLVAATLAAGRVSLEEGSTVGDWRDSQEGLAWGRFPLSVNGCLAPVSRAALAELRELGVRAPRALPDPAAVLAWRDAFRVRLPAAEVRARAGAYLRSLAAPERRALRAQALPDGGTVGSFLDGGPSPFGPELRFLALSLDGEGRALEVMNTDPAFLLFDAPPATFGRRDLRDFLRTLLLPFPLGLHTEAGILVANPALSSDRSHWSLLDRSAYHGAVVWGWQMALIEAGLLRWEDTPMARELPEWGRARAALRRLGAALDSIAHNELWTWRPEGGRLVPETFGLASGSRSESNALQLWNVVPLATELVRETSLAYAR